MRRLLPIVFIMGVLACIAYGGVGDWSSVTLRPFYFQADRGTVTDSVETLSGDTVTVIVSRAYMDSTNATIWAYPAIYTDADTAGHGIAAHYVQGTNSRHLWYVQNVPFGAYNFYEVGGSPDTALVELQNVVITGRAIPDSSFVTQVPRGSIPDTLGPGGSGQFVVQGYLLATAVQTGAITPRTGGTSTPTAVYGWVPIVQPDARGDSVKFGPRTGTQSVRAMFEDRTGGSTKWWTIYPTDLSGSWTWTPPPDDGDAGQVLTTDGTGVTSWETPTGGGGGSGDLTAIGVRGGLVVADSTGPVPLLSVKALGIASAHLKAGAVGDSTKLAAGAVTATRIASSAVKNGNLGTGAVSSAKIASGAVADSTKIGAGAVTRTRVASGSITAVQIMDGQVKSAELAAGAVADSTKIAASAVTATRIAALGVKSGNLGGGAVKDSTKIGTGAVTATRIASAAVKGANIGNGAVSSTKIAAGAIADSTKLASAAVTTTKLGTGSVYSGNIKDGQVKNADLATGAIGDTLKIAAQMVPFTRLKYTGSAPTNGQVATYQSGDLTWSSVSGSGDNVSVNGTAASDADHDDATPAAPAGGANVKWQKDSSTPNNISAYLDIGTMMTALRQKPFYYTDFGGIISSASFMGDHWYKTLIASGTCSPVSSAATTNHIGIMGINASASSNSGASWVAANSTGILLGGGEYFEQIFQIKNTTGFSMRVGFADGWGTTTVTDGAWCDIVGTTLTAYSDNNSSATAADTTYTVSVDTWYRLQIHSNADASVFYYYLYNDSGTRLWRESLSTDLPTGAADYTGSGISAIDTTNPGSNVAIIWVDWLAEWYTRALTR